MFTSDNDYKKTIKGYAIAGLFCIIFSAVYEYFSHGVYSVFMICAPLIPLVGGAVFMFLLKLAEAPKPCRLAMTLYNQSMATLTVGSIMNGVFDIYGSKSAFTPVYWIAGLVLLAGAVLVYVLQPMKSSDPQKF